MNKIKVALVGVGNCASSLVQGRYFYDGGRSPGGLMHERIGGYALSDIEFVLAIDTDARKVGKDLGEAIFAAPNCTTVFQSEIPRDRRRRSAWAGCSTAWRRIWTDHGERGFVRADAPEAERGRDRRRAEGDRAPRCWSTYLPVGSEEATRFYMECALEGRASRWSIACRCSSPAIPQWEQRFREKRPADRRRRHQGAARRDHRPPRPFQPVPRARRRRSTAPTSSTPAAIPTS